jgi:sec-independent protein translocase protein TatA
MSPETVPMLQQAIQMPGGGELLLILLIVLVVFGHNRLPAIGAGFGQAIRNFKKSMAADDDTDKNSKNERADAPQSTEKTQDANKVL